MGATAKNIASLDALARRMVGGGQIDYSRHPDAATYGIGLAPFVIEVPDTSIVMWLRNG